MSELQSDKNQSIPLPPGDAKAYLWKWAIVIGLTAVVLTGAQLSLNLHASFKKANGPEFKVKAESVQVQLPEHIEAAITEADSQSQNLKYIARTIAADFENELSRDSKSAAESLKRDEKKLADSSTALDAALTQIKKFKYLHSNVKVSIRNIGKVAAEHVRIRMPNEGLAVIQWDNEKEGKVVAYNKDIPLGDFPIAKEVSVSIWSVTGLSFFDEPLLAYSNGSVPIDVTPLVPETKTSFWNFIFEKLIFTVLGALGSLWLAAVMLEKLR